MTKLFQPNGYKHMEFSRIVAKGENPKGFTAQTANGTAKAGNHPGWNRAIEIEMPQVPATGPWGNGNRTGE